LGPPFIGNESAYFLSVNRNKRSIIIDFKKEEGLRLIKQMVTKADVLVENYIPGKLDKFGLGYEDLKVLNPSLIYASVNVFLT
jgi:crotonobetainyl-CoA:carnitine CoA-transferase CaiB-like acyl-CoA transferase